MAERKPEKSKKVKKRVYEEPPTSNRVVAYIRVSTSFQDASGLSQLEQQTEIEKFCQARDLSVYHYFTEVISGAVKAADRPQLRKALQLLEQGVVSGLIVTKLDRLGRGAADTIALIDKLNAKKYKFYSVKENIDCSTIMGQAMMGLLCVFANMERNMISERVQLIMDGKKRRGELCGRCPFGMKVELNSNGVKMLVPDEEEQETINLVKKLRATIVTRKLRSGKERKQPMTYQEISQELMRIGRKNRYGEVKWFPSQMLALARSKLDFESDDESEGDDESESSEVEDDVEKGDRCSLLDA